MKLSIYCGLRAMGWIVHTDNKIIDYGIKRLSFNYDNYYEFIKGLPISVMVNRREKRQARRNNWRRKSRRENLRFYLEQNGYEQTKSYTREQLLKLRVKALSEQLSKSELAAVFLNMQRKRGYKSLRGVSDNEDSDYLNTIALHEDNRMSYKSIADYLLTFDSSKDIIFNRASYEEEFNAIAEYQQFDDKFRKRVFNLIYFQNPLKKGKVNTCKYEPNKKVTHASNPIYQEFRMWRDVNNIIIWDREDNEVPISAEMRKIWFNKLFNGKKLTKAVCCKDLKLKKPSQYSWLSGKHIAGNPHRLNSEMWQDVYSATDDMKLTKLLHTKYKLKGYEIDEILDMDFSTLGYADFSVKAIKKILSQLRKGIKLKQAILKVYGVVDFKNESLRNWFVEKHYNSYKSLVDKLCQKYDIKEVKFEIDYLLKAGNKQRKNTYRQQNKKVKDKHKHLSSYDLLKLQLWEETEGISPYQEGPIDKEELFTDKWNIDHIVPKSKLFNSSYNNMVLCPKKLNTEKGNLFTGIEYAEKLNISEHYKSVVDKFPQEKQKYLKMQMGDIPRDEISSRQCSDYNTKCFATVGKNTLNIPNKLIQKFMTKWELNKYKSDDARYYLCKAFILANFNQETVDYFDNIQDVENNPYGLKADLPLIDFENAPIFLQRPKYVRKTNNGYTPRCQLHKEKVYGERIQSYRNSKGREVKEVLFKIRQPLTSITQPMVRKIMDKAIQQLVQERINEKGNLADALISFEENPVMFNNKPVKSVSVLTKATRMLSLHSTNNEGVTSRKKDFDRNIDFVFSSKNYSIELEFVNEKRINKKIVPIMTFIDELNGDGFNPNSKIRLQFNDIIRFNNQLYFVSCLSSSLSLRNIYDLTATNLSINNSHLKNMSKVLINELGEIIKEVKLCKSPK